VSGLIECEHGPYAAMVYDVLEKHGIARFVGVADRTLAVAPDWLFHLLVGQPFPHYLDTLLAELGPKAVESAYRLGGHEALGPLWLEAGRRFGARSLHGEVCQLCIPLDTAGRRACAITQRA